MINGRRADFMLWDDFTDATPGQKLRRALCQRLGWHEYGKLREIGFVSDEANNKRYTYFAQTCRHCGKVLRTRRDTPYEDRPGNK